ncbi:MAG: SDR family NAD(P)-dependent oxidoreductase [Bacteroidales bacterium]|nr:SDR family NAD(P)-dependent oxidoreductase [Bacteroidales bacterium]MCF8352287.1 SDR family NAD(P)-dependent oxidoreductase [Bacteroidales bacterium]MCF8377185.1 SDR family NAD(P)-dependent oxidoreductase [Bacteroidales bacterium]MCF8401056.1 SDR family NAD(P)-dependent oxidoreductase [Bacteroidales bacterium]
MSLATGRFRSTQDITEFDYAKLNISNFLKEVKTLDLVILNAGILNDIKDMEETEIEELRKSMDVNVWGNKVALDAALAMTKVKQVVAISSGAAVNGNRGWNTYAISKAAFKMMISLYAQEAPGTHFSSIAPGLIDTSMQDYITSLPDDKRFPSIDRLKAAKGTLEMPEPEEAAPRLIEKFEKALKHDSGTFLDVRTM